MADRNDPTVGAGRSSVERSEDTSFSGSDRDVPLRLDTAAGDVLFNSEGFMADVVNSVNDLILSGFDSLEEFAAEALGLQNEEARCALRNGVDKIYNKVQDNIDEHLSRWELICRAHYFSMISDARVLSSSDIEAVVPRESRDAAGIEELQEQEEMVHKELCSLRSQLITVERDASRMRRELTSLERNLALRSKVIGDLKNLAYFDGAILEEVMKSADALKNNMEKVSSLQMQRCRNQYVPSVCLKRGDAEMNLPPGSKEIVQPRPQVTDTTADPGLHQLLSR